MLFRKYVNSVYGEMSVNRNNASILRIVADVKELAKHPSSRYSASPLEDSMCEWHFTSHVEL